MELRKRILRHIFQGWHVHLRKKRLTPFLSRIVFRMQLQIVNHWIQIYTSMDDYSDLLNHLSAVSCHLSHSNLITPQTRVISLFFIWFNLWVVEECELSVDLVYIENIFFLLIHFICLAKLVNFSLQLYIVQVSSTYQRIIFFKYNIKLKSFFFVWISNFVRIWKWNYFYNKLIENYFRLASQTLIYVHYEHAYKVTYRCAHVKLPLLINN